MSGSNSDPPQREWRPAPPVTATHPTTRRPDRGQDQLSKAVLEYVGRAADDVLLGFDKQHTEAIAALRQLPRWARRWDAAAGVWRIHPRFAPGLTNTLRRLGFDVQIRGPVTP
jgi:hypothetical protein